jgi:hypothetical protein
MMPIYNRGLRECEDEPVRGPEVELFKVTHIDLDNVVSGLDGGVSFVTPTNEGFLYLKGINDVVKAYSAGELYVVEGNYRCLTHLTHNKPA